MSDLTKLGHDLAADVIGEAGPEIFTPTLPIQIPATPSQAIAGTVIGAILLLLTGSGTLIGFLSARDLVGLFRWLHEADGVAYVSAAGLVGTLVWRVVSSLRKHARVVTVANAAPDAVAVVR